MLLRDELLAREAFDTLLVVTQPPALTFTAIGVHLGTVEVGTT